MRRMQGCRASTVEEADTRDETRCELITHAPAVNVDPHTCIEA